MNEQQVSLSCLVLYRLLVLVESAAGFMASLCLLSSHQVSFGCSLLVELLVHS
jgi:hypothetical protein